MPSLGTLLSTVAIMAAQSILGQSIAQTPSPESTTLYIFQGGSDGSDPRANLLIGPDGSLYGTTNTGGPSGLGTVFQLRRPVSPCGRWTETVLHSFAGKPDGEYPGTSLIFDNGALYGITGSGGAFGAGLVFELRSSIDPAGAWRETVIYNFTGGADGSDPVGALVRGRNGALYGAAALGGSPCPVYYGCGVVFELDPAPAAGIAWIEKVLYSFQGGSDGTSPPAGVVFGRDGALYGTTSAGGAAGYGSVFQMQPNCGGGLFTGSCPMGCGIVFELRPVTAGDEWTESVIHSFAGFPNDGELPIGSLLLGRNGALYGTTDNGGSGICPYGTFGLPGCGAIFELSGGRHVDRDHPAQLRGRT